MHIEFPADLSTPGAIERLLAAHRSVFGDLRMEGDEGDSGGTTTATAGPLQGEDGGSLAGAAEDGVREGANLPTLEQVVADLNLTPEQIAGRLEASRKWEQRAKSQDNVARADYDRVVAERDELQRASETEQEAAVRQAREDGAAEARAEFNAANVTAAARIAMRARGAKDEDVESFVNETNLSAFVSDDGQVDDERLMARVDRYAGTAGGQKWPGTGQDRRGGAVKESGSDLYDRLYGSK